MSDQIKPLFINITADFFSILVFGLIRILYVSSKLIKCGILTGTLPLTTLSKHSQTTDNTWVFDDFLIKLRS